MNKILFTGGYTDISEQYGREKFERLSPIQEFQTIRDGDAQHPYVLLMIEISDELAYRIKGRLTDNYHKGHMIHARLLLN
jgi:hypothetical protein